VAPGVAKIDKRRRPRPAPPPVATQNIVAGGANGIWRRHGWRILALWVLVFAAYSNSFQASLLFDSPPVIEQDPRIREATPQNIRSILTGGYWYVNATAGLYRPVTTFSYLLNYAVLGNDTRPAGYHWINFALHCINVALVYALGLLIFGQASLALALAAIWGLHPVLTESVTNIVGRADLLAAFGVLAGLLCHAGGVSVAGRRRLVWLAVMVVAQTVGLFSKESAAVLPGVMLLYDLIWPERATWRSRAPAYAALALPFAAFFYLRGGLDTHMLVEFTENPLLHAGFWTARLTAVKVIGKFLWLFLWPARLSADYSYNAVPLFGSTASFWENAEPLIAVAVCLVSALLAVLLALRRSRTGKPLLFFLGFFFVALLPTSNLIIIIGSIMAERFLYLPSVGLAGCVVAASQVLGQRSSLKWRYGPQAAWIAMGLVCLVFAGRTYARNFDWQDERSLWSSTVNVCPFSARPHYNLGTVLAQIPGQLPNAIAEFEAALRIRPDYAEAHYNLGNALALLPGRMPEAIAEYEAALRSAPNLIEAHYSLGNALSHTPGRLPDAITEYQAALRIQPDYVYAHNNLGTALARTPGRLPDAIAEFEAALHIRPDYADAHNNLGNALAETPGRLQDAIAEYKAALRIDPNHLRSHINLGDALAQVPGRLPEAIAEYGAALRIRPDPQLQQMVDRLRAGQQ
jgi:tetratricopeptide (TPR) repeat protein